MKHTIVFLFMVVCIFSLIYIGNEKVVIGEIECVDGLNRVNLEGIMCEETETMWFGVDQFWSVLMTIVPIIYALVVFKYEK